MRSFQNSLKQINLSELDNKSKNKSTTKLVRPKYDAPAPTMSKRKKNDKRVESHEARSSETVFKNQLKQIIKLNEDYFINKVKATEDLRPKNHKLNIPSKLGKTVYNKDYKKQNKRYTQCSRSQDYCDNKTIQTPFFGLTTYDSQYLQYPESAINKLKNSERTTDQNSPIYSLTQYGSNFKDWEIKNTLPPMKPYLKCSATFMQFQGNSTYNKQFVKKKNKNYSPIKREDKKKKNDVLYLSTTNQKQFMKKNMLNSKVNFKPRNSTAATGLLFKGSTEYQGQFQKIKKSHQIRGTQTLEDLRNLIFNI